MISYIYGGIKMEIGENIKQFRLTAKYTQKRLAEECGVAAITIRQYESGKREPNREMITKIAEVLRVSPVILTWGTEIGEEWQNLLDSNKKIKNSSSETLEQLLFAVKNIIIANDNADIFTEMPEEDLLYYFWNLNSNGQQKVTEYARDLTQIPNYKKEVEAEPEVKAAHARTDITTTEEMKKHDDDIMDDSDF